MLFPFLLILFFHDTKAGWQDVFLNTANLENIEIINCEMINTARKTILVQYYYDDIYKKSLAEKSAATVKQDRCQAMVTYPIQRRGWSHFLQTDITITNLSADNRKDQTGVMGLLTGAGFDQTVTWAVKKDDHLLGIRAALRKSAGTTVLKIHEFPHSDDARLNKYLLDWLPLTFGDSINADFSTDASELCGWYTLPIDKNSTILLYLSRYTSRYRPTFRYLNTTNKDTLNGNRQLDIPFDTERNRIAISWMRPNFPLTSFTVGYSGIHLGFSSDNNPPPGADFEDLGNGFLDYNSVSLITDYIYNGHKFSAGISLAGFYGNFNLQTPVLGYTSLLFIPVPIAHKASGHINSGFSYSQKLCYLADFRIKQIVTQLSINYLHSRYSLRIDGTAQLEFGLSSSPIDYPVKIDANIFDLDFQISRTFNQIAILYNTSQLLPIIRRIDKSPIRFAEEVTKRRVRERGGRTHQLGIEYRF